MSPMQEQALDAQRSESHATGNALLPLQRSGTRSVREASMLEPLDNKLFAEDNHKPE